MEFRELKTFQVVACLLSFNKAASILNLAQSTVSAQIRSLENSLKKDLFIRSGRTISLSPAGEKLMIYTQRLVNIEKEIQADIGSLDDKYGNLTIKTPQTISTYFFPEIIKEFQLIFPNIGFDIDWCTSFNLLDLFNSGTIDLAFLITDSFVDKKLHIDELTKIKLVLAVNPQHELLSKKRFKIKDLNDQTLLFAKSDCNYKNILQKRMLQSDVKEDKSIEINSMDAIKRLLVLSDGVAFLPEIAIKEELDNGELKTLDYTSTDFDAKLIMIWSKEKHISKTLEAFKIMIKKSIA